MFLNCLVEYHIINCVRKKIKNNYNVNLYHISNCQCFNDFINMRIMMYQYMNVILVVLSSDA